MLASRLFPALGFLLLGWTFALGGDSDRVAIEYAEVQERNQERLSDYTWDARIEIFVKGEQQSFKNYHVTLDALGQRSMVSVVRGVAERPREEFETLVGAGLVREVSYLLDKYLHPSSGTLVDFFAEWRSGVAVAGDDCPGVCWADLDDLDRYGIRPLTVEIIHLAVQKRRELANE